MKVKLVLGKPKDSPLLCELVSEDGAKKPSGEHAKHILRLYEDKEFCGKFGETALIHLDGGIRRLLLVGTGKKDDAETYRRASSMCFNTAVAMKLKSFDVIARKPYELFCPAFAEGLVLCSFKFDKYKTKSEDESDVETAHIFAGTIDKKTEREVQSRVMACEHTNLARTILTDNADIMNPVEVTRIIKENLKGLPVKMTVIEGEELKRKGLNLIYAVGKGSQFPPRLVLLEYNGNPKSKKVHGLVGKGITFDSGGINLKPTGFIETMRYDKSGAVAVFCTVKAAAEKGLAVNIAAALPFAENAIGSRSYKPGDMFKAYNGKFIEIANTDAEGRLVLSDALSYLEKNYKPDSIVELSTLTGAILVTFGEYFAGLMTESDRLAKALTEAGERSGERMWRLPVTEDYKEEVKGELTDVCNLATNRSRNSGSIMGGVFLMNFVEKAEFAHLDIAGTAWYERNRFYMKKGPTAYGVRLLLEYLCGLEG